MRLLFVLATVAAGGIALAACSGGDAGGIVVRASDQLRFEPDKVQVRVGEKMRLTLDNRRGKTLHDLTVDEFPAAGTSVRGSVDHGGHGTAGETASGGIHIAAEPGKKATIEFVAQRPGRYTFYCTVSGHRLGGMEGVIIVVDGELDQQALGRRVRELRFDACAAATVQSSHVIPSGSAWSWRRSVSGHGCRSSRAACTGATER